MQPQRHNTRVPRRPSAAGSRDRTFLWSFNTLLGLLALAALAGLWRVVGGLALHVPLDPDEGWNAYHALAALNGEGPYPAAGSFMTDNYPPLSFYVVGLAGRLVGDNIIAGRLISLGAFLCVAYAIAVSSRRMGCTGAQAIFSALFFVCFLLLFSDYVGMNDPQLLGHAVQLAGLSIVVANSRRVSNLVAAALLFAVGGFVKHNLVALPVATGIWLAFQDRRAAARFAMSLAAFTLIGLGAFRLGFGFDLLHRLNSPRAYSLTNIWRNFGSWFVVAALPLGALCLARAYAPHDRHVALCFVYASISTVIGAMLLGGDGVDVNAMFDADIALALGAGMSISRLLNSPLPRRNMAATAVAGAFILPLSGGLAAAAEPDWLDPAFWLHPLADESADAGQDIQFLRVRRGPAMCETLAYCYWAGKPATVDVFNLDQQFATHSRDESGFIGLLDGRYFRVVQFDGPAPYPFPEPVRKTLARNYRVDHTDADGVFLIPK